MISEYSALKSSVVQYSIWHIGADIQSTGKKGYWRGEGERMGDERAEGSFAIGDGVQAVIFLPPDMDGEHFHIFENSQLELCRGTIF